VLYREREAAKKTAFDRFSGTAIGCLVGWGSAVWWHENILLYDSAPRPSRLPPPNCDARATVGS
jgi:hypothetical protein